MSIRQEEQKSHVFCFFGLKQQRHQSNEFDISAPLKKSYIFTSVFKEYPIDTRDVQKRTKNITSAKNIMGNNECSALRLFVLFQS